MANEKFSQLPTVTNANLADIICAVQGGVSVQETLAQVISLSQSNLIKNFAGNPNGNVAGTVYGLCWDTTNSNMYVCTTSGSAATAVWTPTLGSIPIPVPVIYGGTGLTTIPEKHILYSPTTDSLAALPTANDSVLVTDNSFNISWSNALPSNLIIPTPTITGPNGTILEFGEVAPYTNHVQILSGDSGMSQPAGVYAVGPGANANLGIISKGNGVVVIGSGTPGATVPMVLLPGGPNVFSVTIPSLTAFRNLTLPDADVTLVGGTMANAPVNTNITTTTSLATLQGSNGFNILTLNDLPAATDYLHINSGPLDNVTIQLVSTNTNASFSINGKGTGGVQIGSTGPSVTPVAFYNGSFRFFMDTGVLTADRNLIFPDANVTLVAGTMANAPVNTNITSMTGLTGALRAPTSILDSNGNIVLNFTGTPGAVNYLDITNFGVTPQIRAIGSAADIDIILDGKGVGGALIRTGTAGTVPLEIGIGGDPFGFDFVLPTLTAQRSLTFPNGNVTLVPGTMATTSQIVVWNSIVGTSQTADVNNGYIIDNAAQTTVTLPAIAAQGSVVEIAGQGAGGWILAANAGQTIKMAASSTSVAGSLTSAEQYDAISVVCVVADTTWVVQSAITTGFTIS